MKLVKLRLNGFRRFKEAVVNLESDVLALVGPNEAGKSSVLQALASVESNHPFDTSDLTDRLEVADEEVIVEIRFLLDPEERALTRDVHGATVPRWFVLEKIRDGDVYQRTEPPIERDLSTRQELAQVLQRATNDTHFRRVLTAPMSIESTTNPPNDTRTLHERFAEHVRDLAVDSQMLPNEVRTELGESLDLFSERLDQVAEGSQDRAERTIARLRVLLAAERQDPHRALCRLLEQRRPRILLFAPAHRSFRNVYDPGEITADQQALHNLLRVGETNPDEVRLTMQEGDAGRIRNLETRLNANLKDAFDASWRQSNVYPEFDIGRDRLTLHVRHPVRGFTLVAEHSDGLKAFIALFAFIRVQATSVPPILLIDEAEQHLHYDAQADLVGMFYRQQAASQVIYTTHSAGCLPHDLGMGVRVVTQQGGPNDETGYSTLRNRFWGEGAGNTPLLLAMGASALAFAPARRALMVVGEGGTETILLPSLFAEVSNEPLDFQVLPGIANISRDKVPDLDLEAPRVVYLVDGDGGGRANRKTLREGGVPNHRILSLPRSYTTEDLVTKEVYADAINEEFRRSNIEARLRADELPRNGRVEVLIRWCARAGVPMPSKVAVAERIAQERAHQALTTPETAQRIKELHNQILEAMRLPDPDAADTAPS